MIRAEPAETPQSRWDCATKDGAVCTAQRGLKPSSSSPCGAGVRLGSHGPLVSASMSASVGPLPNHGGMEPCHVDDGT